MLHDRTAIDEETLQHRDERVDWFNDPEEEADERSAKRTDDRLWYGLGGLIILFFIVQLSRPWWQA